MASGAFEEGGDPGELTGVVHAKDGTQAALIHGLLEDAGIPSLVQRSGWDGMVLGADLLGDAVGGTVMVRSDQAEQARALLTETLDDPAEDFPEPLNARYLAEAQGRAPRNFGRLGGMARIYLWSFAAFAVVFGIFLLLRAL